MVFKRCLGKFPVSVLEKTAKVRFSDGSHRLHCQILMLRGFQTCLIFTTGNLVMGGNTEESRTMEWNNSQSAIGVNHTKFGDNDDVCLLMFYFT